MSVRTRKPLAAADQKAIASYVFDGDLVIPATINDLPSFRAWCLGPSYPDRGLVEYLDGEIWVDLTLEEILGHNAVKTAVVGVLWALNTRAQLGRLYSDRVRLVNTEAVLSCVPNAMFVTFNTFQSGRITIGTNKKNQAMELVGTPDMVLEVVSDSSVRKDTKVLPQLYFRAGIPEYWLIDVRKKPIKFNLYRRGNDGYVSARPTGGWSRSGVFSREFRLSRGTDLLGYPEYNLDVR